MAFPAIRSISGTYSGWGTSDVTVNMPTGITANDGLLMIIVGDENVGPYTAQTGWTNRSYVTLAGIGNINFLTKVASGSDTLTQPRPVGGDSVSIAMYCITQGTWYGTWPTTDTDWIAGLPWEYDSGTAPDPPSLTTAWGSADTLWFAVAGGRNKNFTASFPSGYSNTQLTGSAGVAPPLYTAAKESAAAAENPGAFTGGNGGWAYTLAIRPAAAATSGHRNLLLMGIG